MFHILAARQHSQSGYNHWCASPDVCPAATAVEQVLSRLGLERQHLLYAMRHQAGFLTNEQRLALAPHA
jgi:hypothetical protein